MSVSPACLHYAMCTQHMCGAEKGVRTPWNWLRIVVGCHVDAGNQTQVFCRDSMCS